MDALTGKPAVVQTPENVITNFREFVQRRFKEGTLTVRDIDLAQEICLAAADACWQGWQPAGDEAALSLLRAQGTITDEMTDEQLHSIVGGCVGYRLSGDAFYAGLVRTGCQDKRLEDVTTEDKAMAFLEAAAILAEVLPTLAPESTN
jgi:hypothetical protein